MLESGRACREDVMTGRIIGSAIVLLGLAVLLVPVFVGVVDAPMFVGVAAVLLLLGVLVMTPEPGPERSFWPEREEVVRWLFCLAVSATAWAAVGPVRHALERCGVTNSVAQTLLAFATIGVPFVLFDRFVVTPLIRRHDRRSEMPLSE
jgi:hypothetical protein